MVDWDRVQEVFAKALELAPAERAPYLDSATSDPEERREVDELLASAEQPGEFLDKPLLSPQTELLPDDYALPAPADIGRRIGPYTLLDVIGEGGMGAVFLASRDDDEYRRQVAVKLIRQGRDPEALLRFRNERQILAGLEHPNIARLYDGGTEPDGRPYLVMEHIEGVRLDVFCRNLGIAETLRLFQEVCAAVAFAHQNLLVHRDLKPANILVTDEGVPKLLDFGIAKSLEGSDPATTKPGQHPMTPAYASPEQVRGQLVTTASDVYSLGVVLFELLVGESPYQLEDDSDLTLRVAIRDQDPPRPSVAAKSGDTTTLSRTLRGDLDTIVLKAMRKEPQRRYSSASALSEDIGRYLNHEPVRARRASVGYRLKKFVRRHRLGVAAAVTAVVVLVAFIAALARQTQIANRKSQQAERALGFMARAFQSSDPEQARGREVTAREILDQGSERIRRELANEPWLKATLLGVVGEVYVSLGLFDEAAPLLHEAHELRGDDEEAAGFYQLGELEWWRRDYVAAETFYRQALAMLPDETVLRGQVLRGLGQALVRQGMHEEAESALAGALAILTERFARSDPEVLRCLYGLGLAAQIKGDYTRAEALLREVVSAFRPGGRGPALGRSLADLGDVRYHQGQPEEARLLLEEALPMLREAMDDNTYVAEVLGKLVPVLMELRDNAAAEAVIGEILAILPEDHPGTGIALHNLGKILAQRGDLAAAEETTTEALRRKRHSFGEAAITLCLLGGIALQRGEPVQALSRYQECAVILESVSPAGNPRIAFAYWGLGRSAEVLDGCGAAVSSYRRAYELWRDGVGADHYQTVAAAGRLGECLAEIGEDEEAERLLVESLEVLQARGAESRICEAARRLGNFYRARGLEEKLRAANLPSC